MVMTTVESPLPPAKISTTNPAPLPAPRRRRIELPMMASVRFVAGASRYGQCPGTSSAAALIEASVVRRNGSATVLPGSDRPAAGGKVRSGHEATVVVGVGRPRAPRWGARAGAGRNRAV